MINNDNGFIIVSNILIMPLLLMSIFAALSISSHISYKLKVSYACYTHSLKTQKIITKGIRDLLELNPLARRLRVKRATTQAKLTASIAAQTHMLTIALKKQLNSISIQQLALRSKQQLIILKTTAGAKHQFHQGLLKIKNEALVLRYKTPRFLIRKEYQNSLSPEYYPSPNFSRGSLSFIKPKAKTKYEATKIFERLSTSFIERPTASCSSESYKKEDGIWSFRLKKAS